MRNKLELSIFNRYANQFYKSTLSEWELTKSYKDYAVQVDLDKPFIFSGSTPYDFLLKLALHGQFELESTTVKDKFCDVSLPSKVYGVSGEFDHKRKIVEKKADLNQPIRFVEDPNIFNIEPKTIKSFTGTVDSFVDQVNGFIFEEIDATFFENVRKYRDTTVADRRAEGYYIEHDKITFTGHTTPVDPEDPENTAERFNQYTVVFETTYKRIESPDPLPGWVPWNGVYVFPIPRGPMTIELIEKPYVDENGDDKIIYDCILESGRQGRYRSIDISNTISFQEFMPTIFNTSYVSNFFGINDDGTEPYNKYYSFAEDYLKNLKLIQSFDIIIANAEEDSFGISGKIDPEKLIKDLNTQFNTMLVYYPEEDIIRHEHVSYFNSKKVDFTEAKYDLEPYKFNASETVLERWELADQGADPAHNSTEIDYRIPGEQEETYVVELLMTDFNSYLNQAKYVDDTNLRKKFFIVAADSSDQSIVEFNNVLAIKNLVEKLHDLGRPSVNGTQDGRSIRFASSSHGLTTSLKLTESLKSFLAINPEMRIDLKEGSFYAVEPKINQSGEMTITLRK